MPRVKPVITTAVTEMINRLSADLRSASWEHYLDGPAQSGTAATTGDHASPAAYPGGTTQHAGPGKTTRTVTQEREDSHLGRWDRYTTQPDPATCRR
jgi:hypothetical protein